MALIKPGVYINISDIISLAPYYLLDHIIVDDITWYTLRVYSESCVEYIVSTDPAMWYEIDAFVVTDSIRIRTFQVHEKLYTILALQWSE